MRLYDFDHQVRYLQEKNRGVSDDFMEELGFKPATEPLHKTGHLAGPIAVKKVEQQQFDYDYSEANRLPIGASALSATAQLETGADCPDQGRRRAPRRGRNKNGLVDRRTLSAAGRRIADRRSPNYFPYVERETDDQEL